MQALVSYHWLIVIGPTGSDQIEVDIDVNIISTRHTNYKGDLLLMRRR